jgi:CRP-like cAMP-binding protein
MVEYDPSQSGNKEKKGTYLFHEGSMADEIYYIQSGKVQAC